MSEKPVSPLILRLFGPFELLVNGRPLPRLRSRKGQWLLALLALRSGTAVERGWLAGTLWPESSEAQALNSLRVTLADLRQALGEAAGRLEAPTPQTLRLDLTGAEVDLLAFDGAIARGQERSDARGASLEQAAALYRGSLLEGCAEEWAFQERQAREQAYLQALERLAAQAVAAGEAGRAEGLLRRAVAVDPLRESAQRALMQALAAGGNYAAAVQAYRELRERLHREVNAEPDPETHALFQQLRAKARRAAETADGRRQTAAGQIQTASDEGGGAELPPAVSRLPSGTVTFLLTDIEGGTRLWEQHPHEMRLALARHDALLEEVIVQSGGVVIRGRQEGDSFFAVFALATDAVAAAGTLQRALLAEAWPTPSPLRVRMALHTGEAEPREGEYYGAAVHRCARLRAAGHGGQVLLSLATQEMVRDHLPGDMSLRDLGEHRLKDLVRPERVFQLAGPSLPADFPPLRSLEAFAHNLPVQLTSFIGREAQIAEVKRLMRTTRLLTLTGAGGVGKTRLSLQVAADLVEDFADGVWLVELAPLSDPELVPQVVASALGVREERGRPLAQTLIDNLRARRLLLLLDNCEHLIEASARHAEALLRGCPELVVLATSREPLGIGGETPYRVPMLSLPDPEEMTSLPADPALLLARYESARLFVERAQSLIPGFRVTPQSARSLAEICRRLDGMPLAIELAAARVGVLPLEQIAARVDDAIRLLTGGSRTALPRHQALGALIDWSYDLLPERERTLLRRLSVFAGGWDLEAAEAVGSGQWAVGSEGSGTEPACLDSLELPTAHCPLLTDVLDLLSRLVDKSLVTVDAEREGERRYRLLETVRQYSRQKLEAAGEGAAMRERHLRYFMRVAEEAYPGFFGATQLDSARRLERDHDNLRAARTGCSEAAIPPLLGLRLAGALWWFWNLQGVHSEARRWLEQALARAGGRPFPVEEPETGDPEAARAAARALLAAGAHAMFMGDFEPARRDLEASVALWRQQGEVWELALALRSLGWAHLGLDDYTSAQSAGEESIVLYRHIGDEAGLARSLNLLAQLARRRSDYARAAELWNECLTFARRSGDRWVAATAWVNLAKIAEQQGDLPRARSLYQESLLLRRALSDKSGIADCLEGLAAITLPANGSRLLPGSEAPDPVSPEAAAQMLGAAAALREALGSGWSSPIEWPVSRAQVVADLRAALGEPEFTQAWTLGRSMRLDRVLAAALPGRDSFPDTPVAQN